jgi:PAS domain S-box-containing protein
MSLGVLYYDRKGRVIKANPAAEMMLGLSFEDMDGQTARERKPRVLDEQGKRIPISKLPSTIALRTGKPVRDTIIGYFNPAIESNLWLNVNAIPLFRDNEKKPYMVYATLSDISEQTWAMQSLSESEERYRTLVNSLNDLVFVYDKNDCYKEYYAADNNLLYLSPEYFMGRHLSEVLPKEVNQLFIKKVKQVRKTGRSETFDYSLVINKEPKRFSATLSRHDDGESIVAVVRDITEKHATEEALRSSEHRYRELITSVPEGIGIVDLNEQFVFVNTALAEIFGSSEEVMIGRSLFDFVSPDDKEKVLKGTELRLTGQSNTYEMNLLLDNGSKKVIRVSAVPQRNGDEKVLGSIAVVTDITEKIKADRKLQQKQEEMEIFASLLRHDLGNDLQAIINRIEWAELTRNVDTNDFSDSMDSIKAITYRMAALLRSLGRPLEEIDDTLGDMLTRITNTSMMAHPGILVNVNVSDNMTRKQDMTSFRLVPTVLDNLIRNAALHVGPTVEIFISAWMEGSVLLLEICDDGPGISEEIRDRIFTKGVSTGSGGLGLYLSKTIIEAYNGSIKLQDSDPESGACFLLEIPLR